MTKKLRLLGGSVLPLILLAAITISCSNDEMTSNSQIKAQQMINAIESNTAYKLPGYLCSGKINDSSFGIYNSGGIWYYAVWTGGTTNLSTVSPDMAFQLCSSPKKREQMLESMK